MRLGGAVELTARLPFDVDLWKAQNLCYRFLVMPSADLAIVRPDTRQDEWAAALRDLGLRLRFQPALVAGFAETVRVLGVEC